MEGSTDLLPRLCSERRNRGKSFSPMSGTSDPSIYIYRKLLERMTGSGQE